MCPPTVHEPTNNPYHVRKFADTNVVEGKGKEQKELGVGRSVFDHLS